MAQDSSASHGAPELDAKLAEPDDVVDEERNSETSPPSASDELDAILEDIGFGRHQRFAMLICGLAWTVEAIEISGISLIFVDLDIEWGTTTKDWGHFGSLRSLCGVFGAFLLGMLADCTNRRRAFMLALLLAAVSGCASAASTGFVSFVVLRSICNFASGGCLPVALSLLSENLPPSIRESRMVLMQVYFVSGSMASIYLSSHLERHTGVWRIFLLCTALPALVLLLFSRLVPESPVHLFLHGHRKEAEEVFLGMCRSNGHSEAAQESFVARLRRIPLPVDPDRKPLRDEEQGTPRGGVEALFKPDTILQTVLFGVLWSAVTVGSDFWSWVTELAQAHGVKFKDVDHLLLVGKAFGLAGFFSAAFCANFCGGGPVLRASLLTCAGISAVFAALGSAHAGEAIDKDDQFRVGVLLVSLNFTFDMVWGLLYATTAAAFDALCRASALSVATVCAKAASAAVPTIVGNNLHRNEPVALGIWAGGWATASVVALLVRFAAPVGRSSSVLKKEQVRELELVRSPQSMAES